MSQTPDQYQKELDHFESLDYSQYPIQPCLRSLYHISKIAQNQPIYVNIPSTILIGFNDDNRVLYNCPNGGHIIVNSAKITPREVNNYILKYLVT